MCMDETSWKVEMECSASFGHVDKCKLCHIILCYSVYAKREYII